MPCYHPMTAWRSKDVNKSGKRSLVFSQTKGYSDLQVEIPCGQCIGCRIDRTKQWAVRAMHESSLHDTNSFITLTYNPESLPSDHSVHRSHLQNFFKRLRKKLHPKKIRYFACGEYGEKQNRPHYHSIIFGYDFPDKKPHSQNHSGDILYRSSILESAWPFGHCLIGECTFESCAYIARYCLKKRMGKPDSIDKHGKTNASYYELCDPETGEIHILNPEFSAMSNRPGIGKNWLLQYKQDTDKDFFTLNGKKHKLPKYYDKILEEDDPEGMRKRKIKRRLDAEKNKENNTYERLQVREEIQNEKIKLLKRNKEALK